MMLERDDLEAALNKENTFEKSSCKNQISVI